MHTLILSGEDVQRIALHLGLDALMDEMIERLADAFRTFDPTATQVPVRDGFAYTAPIMGLVEWMPCMERGEHVTIKVVGYHPGNAERHDLPTILSTVSAYDTSTGHLRCLMDGTLLTALRTAAASAIATEQLAAPDADTVGLIGTGAQAVSQLHALTRRFAVQRVRIYDIDPAAQASFADRVASFAGDLRIEAATPEAIVQTADIICTATSVEIGAGPVFEEVEPKPWAHVNAVGSDFPGKVELPAALLRRSFVCPDVHAQAVKEGECQQLDADAIGPDLYEVVQQPERYAHLRERLTVFDSTGWALEDHVAMDLFTDYATRLGLGTRLEVEAVPDDPKNPYEFATSAVAALVTK